MAAAHFAHIDSRIWFLLVGVKRVPSFSLLLLPYICDEWRSFIRIFILLIIMVFVFYRRQPMTVLTVTLRIGDFSDPLSFFVFGPMTTTAFFTLSIAQPMLITIIMILPF